MTSERPTWQEIESLYHRVAELPPADARGILEEISREAPERVRRVEQLLEAGEDTSSLLAPGGALSDDVWSEIEEKVEQRFRLAPGQLIGKYRIERELGRGGMAVVYLARRDDPDLPQQVALKLIRAPGDGDSLTRRFVQERRILATLDHPNIARFLDAGVTEQGSPYLVMELVDGMPIDWACDQQRLGLRQRVDLFWTVADAVHSAHQRLVVHRDLKPSNILVDAGNRPKLLDFGIAKLLANEEDALDQTRTQNRFLTPEYATPEQIRGQPATTASDVYQLGLLLYELLAGCRAHQLSDSRLATLEREVCEQSVRPPSAAFRQLDLVHRQEIAISRSTSPERLARQLTGDLDNIVLKSLANDPARRYGSVAQLLDDLERWRQGEPVRARPPTLRYRFSKFVRRNRVVVTAAALLSASLLAGFATTLWQARAAGHERDRAVSAATRAERVSELLIGIFESSDPDVAQGVEVTGRELLDRSLWRVENELAEEPLLRAQMNAVLGRVYSGLGSFERGEELLRRALEGLRDHADTAPDAALLATTLDRLAEVRLELDDDAGAEALLQEALELRQQQMHGDPAAVAESLSRLGFLRHWQRRLDEAQRFFERALELRRSTFGEQHPATAQSLLDLGWLLYERRQFEDAERLLTESLEIRRRILGDRHPDVAQSIDKLAAIETVKGNAKEAERLYRESLEMTRAVFGDGHPRTLIQQNNLAQMQIRRGDSVQAEDLLRTTEAAIAEYLGELHPYRALALMNLGTSLRRQERFEEAIEALEESVSIRRKIRLVPDVGTAMALYTLGLAQRDVGALPESAESLAEALAIYRQVEPAESQLLANALVNTGEALVLLGELDQAEPLLLAGLDLRTAAYGTDGWITAMTRNILGGLRSEQGRTVEAAELLEDSLALLRAKVPDHRATRQAEARLARFRARWQ